MEAARLPGPELCPEGHLKKLPFEDSGESPENGLEPLSLTLTREALRPPEARLLRLRLHSGIQSHVGGHRPKSITAPLGSAVQTPPLMPWGLGRYNGRAEQPLREPLTLLLLKVRHQFLEGLYLLILQQQDGVGLGGAGEAGLVVPRAQGSPFQREDLECVSLWGH